MGRKGRKNGIGSMLFNAIWVLIVAGVVLAALQLSGIVNMETGFNNVLEKTSYLAECVPSWSCEMNLVFDDVDGGLNIGGEVGDNGINVGVGDNAIKLPGKVDGGLNLDGILVSRDTPGYRGPSKGEPYVNDAGRVNKGSALLMLDELKTVEDSNDDADVGYSRKDWKHWSGTEGRSCWNTREEILHRDATPDSVLFLDKNKEVTDNYDDACAVGTPYEDGGKIKVDTENSGRWIGPYNGKKITDSKTIDIDHVIPLSNAAKNGGQAWSSERKEEFANDPINLLVTSAKENRTKGDKGPGKYMPPLKSYRCQYSKTYTTIAYKYDISITETDYKVLNENISSCQH